MADEHDYVFHANRLLENPAWKRILADLRAQLDRERDSLEYHNEGRRYVSIAQSLLTKLERQAHSMAESGKVEQFHRQQEARAI